MKRRLIFLAVALVATLVTLPAAPASASTCGLSRWCETDYYTSPAHTALVGWKYIACGGGVITSGQVTPYYVNYSGTCAP